MDDALSLPGEGHRPEFGDAAPAFVLQNRAVKLSVPHNSAEPDVVDPSPGLGDGSKQGVSAFHRMNTSRDRSKTDPNLADDSLRSASPIHCGASVIALAKPITTGIRCEYRDRLLTPTAKAWGGIDDIRLGRIASFAGIAEREAVGERHIRLLAPLAFLSPRIIAAIADGTAPADLTVTGLAKALPYSWAEQERAISRNA